MNVVRKLLIMVGAVLASASLTACAGGPGYHVEGSFGIENPAPLGDDLAPK